MIPHRLTAPLAACLLLLGAPRLPAAPFAYIPNHGSTDLTVIDTATDAVVATVPLPISMPETAAVTPDGRKVFVASPFHGTVAVVDATTNTVTGPSPPSAASTRWPCTPRGRGSTARGARSP